MRFLGLGGKREKLDEVDEVEPPVSMVVPLSTTDQELEETRHVSYFDKVFNEVEQKNAKSMLRLSIFEQEELERNRQRMQQEATRLPAARVGRAGPSLLHSITDLASPRPRSLDIKDDMDAEGSRKRQLSMDASPSGFASPKGSMTPRGTSMGIWNAPAAASGAGYKKSSLGEERGSSPRHGQASGSGYAGLADASKEEAAAAARAELGKLQEAQREIRRLRNDLDATKAEVARQLDSAGRHMCDKTAEAAGLLADYQKGMQMMQGVRTQNRALYNQMQDLRGAIRVLCRIRPALSPSAVVVVGRAVGAAGLDQCNVRDKNNRTQTFTMDRVFGPRTSQSQVHEETAPLVRSVLDGHSVCIFAYGQTGSGKTYTMSGPQDCASGATNLGLQYRVLDDLFQQAEARSWESNYGFSLLLLEVYNDQLRDLLGSSNDPKAKPQEVKLVDGVASTTRVPVTCTAEVMQALGVGEARRATESTALNAHSSRSHEILTILVEATDKATGVVTCTKLQLVDLAGSERVKHSEAAGDRLKEAQCINRSLSALGDVVCALQNKSNHVPYRNSKLTQVLQDSMAGSAKMVMLLHVSPEVESAHETLSTLSFGMRVAAVERASASRGGGLLSAQATDRMRMLADDLADQTKIVKCQSAEIDELRSSNSKANRRVQLLETMLATRDSEISSLKIQLASRRPLSKQSLASLEDGDVEGAGVEAKSRRSSSPSSPRLEPVPAQAAPTGNVSRRSSIGVPELISDAETAAMLGDSADVPAGKQAVARGSTSSTASAGAIPGKKHLHPKLSSGHGAGVARNTTAPASASRMGGPSRGLAGTAPAGGALASFPASKTRTPGDLGIKPRPRSSGGLDVAASSGTSKGPSALQLLLRGKRGTSSNKGSTPTKSGFGSGSAK